MADRILNQRFFWIFFAVLLALGLFLGAHAGRTAMILLGEDVGMAHVDAPAAVTNVEVETLTVQDSLIAQAEQGIRDPFRPPYHLRKKTTPQAPAPTPVVLPKLKALLFDHVNPTARLSAAEETSAWLRVKYNFYIFHFTLWFINRC